MFKRLTNFFYAPINPSIVCIFRIIFGLIATYQIIYYFKVDYTYQFIAGPEVLFYFNELSFLQPLPLPILKGLHFLLLISTVCITLGVWYRYAISFFFIVFSYFSFMDSTLYNNHIYLFSLFAFAMIFISADEKYSIKSRKRKDIAKMYIPAWHQYILMFLIALPYFFGGIAKLSSNWLHTNLVSEILSATKNNFLTQLFSNDTLIAFVKYGGLIYDLGIVFLLLFKRTRLFAVGLILIFNLTNNSLLFDDIGVFPLFMIVATILFFNPERVGNFTDTLFIKKKKVVKLSQKEKKRLKKQLKSKDGNATVTNGDAVVVENSDVLFAKSNKGLVTGLLLVFLIFHLVFPFRYLLHSNNPEWYGPGVHFAWRMKLQAKKVVTLNLTMQDRASGATGEIKEKTFISHNQSLHLVDRPVNLVLLAKYLKPKIEKQYGIVNPKISAEVIVEFNGLPAQQMIVPTVDLTEVDERDYNDLSWIVPLKMSEED